MRLIISALIIFWISNCGWAQSVAELAQRNSLQCDFGSVNDKLKCFEKVQPAIDMKVRSMMAEAATLRLVVKFPPMPTRPATSGAPVGDARAIADSVGTAFYVNTIGDRGYFLTAKHVVMGGKLWSTVKLPDEDLFLNFESALENYLGSGSVTYSLFPAGSNTAIPAKLVAIDPNSDLALLYADGLNDHPSATRLSYFKPIQIAEKINCKDPGQINSLGYAESGGGFSLTWPDPKSFKCEYWAKTYTIGGNRYRIALFETKMAFVPGMSGGPVLDEQNFLIGVVSGANPINDVRFFVPLPAIHSFIRRFVLQN